MEFSILTKHFLDLKILFVEDEKYTNKMMTKTIRYFCKNIDSSLDCNEAIKMIQSNKYDIIITDLIFPKSNGIDFIERIRKRDKNIPIFVYTGIQDDEIFKKCLELNVLDIFIKPMDIEPMFNRIIEKTTQLKM